VFQRELPLRADAWELAAAGGALQVGAAEADITPPRPLYLGGFGLARRSTGVHLPLKARAVVFACGGAKIAVVGVDNLGLQREDADWIKAGVAGFANGAVLLCSSHTHAAPDLIGFWGFYLLTSGRDREYLAQVRRGVAAAVAAAEAAALPARLARGEALLPPLGLVKNSNVPGLFDRRVTVLHATAADGRSLGTLLHLACHPEVLRRQNTRISADYVGELCDRWRAAGHGQAVFVNGALGAMVTPDGWPRDDAGMPRVAGGLFDSCSAALRAAQPLDVRSLEVRRRDVFLPLSSFGLGLARLTLAIPREAYGDCVRTGVGWLRLGPLEAVMVPGEIEPGLAERVRRRARRPDLLVFGLVDDEVGYLMSEKDARDREFAYERTMSPGPEAGELVVEALVGR
jgi:hypothetical protein